MAFALTPIAIAKLFSIGAGFGAQISEMTGNDELAQKLAIASMVSGVSVDAGGVLKDAFKDPKIDLKIGKGTKGVGPFANPDEYIDGLTGSIANKTQQNFSAGVLRKEFLGDTFKSNQASLFDPNYNVGLLG